MVAIVGAFASCKAPNKESIDVLKQKAQSHFDKGEYAEAVELWQKAANEGDAESQNTIGLCYYYGKGVSQDYAKAVEWLQKAAKQGFAWAQEYLERMNIEY